MDATLHITLLGGLSARFSNCPDSPPMTRFRTQKTAALLAFLAFHTGTPQPREELIESFWPDTDLDAGRMSLRTGLASLRKVLGEALETSKASVTLHTTTDLQQFALALRAARNERLPETERVEYLRKAVAVYGGPLLPGFYDDWVLRERDRLEAEHRAALTALARWYAALGEYHFAEDYARRAVASDPLSEEIRADLIRLLKRSGAKAEARRQFEDIARLLKEQLEAEPSTFLTALVTDIPRSEPAGEELTGPTVRLPVSRGRFRGRREALIALTERVAAGTRDASRTRLVTLFGPGGIGKTRLAIEAARRIAAQGLVDAVWFVPLATATTEEQVWISILQSLEISRVSGSSEVEQISARLARTRASLLIFDNVEQVSLEAGEVAAALLARTPSLTLLATSRRRLGLPEEELVTVTSLSVDEAIGLFLDRARSVSPEFAPGNAETMRVLMGRLEGFPLAIELAAAWSAVLSPSEMAEQLQQGLLLLPERGEGEARHFSLTAAIQWSVALLNPEMQRAFCSLSVFRGGWDATAAERVCSVHREALASLRDRSMITAQTQDDGIRFGMHEALREFGEAALSTAEQANLSQLHAAYFVSAVDDMVPASLLHNYPNLRAALQAATPGQERHLGRKLVSFWDVQGEWREGRQALERIVANLTEADSLHDRAEFLHALGRVCYNLCDFEASQTYHQEALELGRASGDHRGIGRGYHALAALSFHHDSDLGQALRLTQEALTHFTLADDDAGQATALIGLGVLSTAAGDNIAARDFQRRSLAIAEAAGLESLVAKAHQRLGISSTRLGELEEAEYHLCRAYEMYTALREPPGMATVSVDRGVLAHNRGDMVMARHHYEGALSQFMQMGESWAAAICLANLARIEQSTQNYDFAASQWAESLRLRLQNRDNVSTVAALDGIAGFLFCIAADRGRLDTSQQAIRLRAACARLRSELELCPPEAEDRPEKEAQIRGELGEEATLTAQQEGTALSLEAAVALASDMLREYRQ